MAALTPGGAGVVGDGHLTEDQSVFAVFEKEPSNYYVEAMLEVEYAAWQVSPYPRWRLRCESVGSGVSWAASSGKQELEGTMLVLEHVSNLYYCQVFH